MRIAQCLQERLQHRRQDNETVIKARMQKAKKEHEVQLVTLQNQIKEYKYLG